MCIKEFTSFYRGALAMRELIKHAKNRTNGDERRGRSRPSPPGGGDPVVNNGRVALLGADGDGDAVVSAPSASLYAQDRPRERPLGDFHVSRTALLRDRMGSEVSDLYFSAANVDALQEALRYQVWAKTNGEHAIDRQSDTELMIVMRSLYLQYSRNSPYNVKEQVRELNARVLDECVPKIVSELSAYLQYLRDASQLPVPLAHGELATMKGTRSLEMKPFL